MSAQIIPLKSGNGAEISAPADLPERRFFGASLSSAALRLWQRTRLTVEVLGWIMVAASVIAAVKP